MHEAKTQLSKLVAAAEAGEVVVIQRQGRPVARLVAEAARRPVSEAFGVLEGRMRIAGDFDASLPDELLDLLEGP